MNIHSAPAKRRGLAISDELSSTEDESSEDEYPTLDMIKAHYARLSTQEVEVLEKAVLRIQRAYRRSLLRRVVEDHRFLHSGRRVKYSEFVSQETLYVARLKECVTVHLTYFSSSSAPLRPCSRQMR